ncbi:heterodisulfide reductase subunit F, partial [Citrobacter sp. AAK_AS5]
MTAIDNDTKNIYKPYLMRIAAITEEAPGVRTFRLEFADAKEGEAFQFKTGQ